VADSKTILNRRARHDYFIDDTVEAGIVLTGSEVKSLRDGRANLTDSYARVIRGEALLINAHISPYDPAHIQNHEPTRSRRLLLHRREIDRLWGQLQQKGLTLVPLRLYFNDKGRAKVELGVGRGKKQYDKRQTTREREAKREAARAMRTSTKRR
jgi:SsrA-binding protein